MYQSSEPQVVRNFRTNLLWAIAQRSIYGTNYQMLAKEAGVSHTVMIILARGYSGTSGRPVIPTVSTANKVTRALGYDFRWGLLSHREFIAFMLDDSRAKIWKHDQMLSFRQNFGWLQKQTGVTATAMADYTGMGQPYLSRIKTGSAMPENGKPMEPTIGQAHRIAAFFDANLVEMFGPAPVFKRWWQAKKRADRLAKAMGSEK